MAPKIKNQTLPATYTEFLTNYEQYKPAGTKPWHTGATSFDAIIANNDKISNSPAANSQIGIPGSPQISAPGAATVPGAVPPTVADTKTPYEIWKEMYGEQAQLMPTQSYTDWLMAGGMAGAAQRAHDEAVRAAETDYEKTKALYGANAERLGRAGLTGSGYGDYLTGAGFSAMQGAKVAAADTKALTEAQQRSDYASYLMGVEQTNAQLQAQADAANRQSYAEYLTREGGVKETIDSMMKSGQDDASIKAYVQQHYGNEFDASLDGWITAAHMYNDPIIAEANTVKTEAENETRLTELRTAYNNLAGAGAEYARGELSKLGYTEAEISRVMSEYSSATAAQIRAAMNLSSATADSIPTAADIRDAVELGKLTRADGDILIAEAQAKRSKLLEKEFEAIADIDDAAAAASAQADWISALSGLDEEDLTDESREKLYGMLADGYISAAVETSRPVAALANELSKMDLNGMSDAAYNGLMQEVADSVNIIRSKFNSAGYGITISLGTNEAGVDARQDITFKVENTGTRTVNKIGEGNKVGKKLGDGTNGEIKVYNGVLYAYSSVSKRWLRLERIDTVGTGSKEASNILYDILVDYYS